MSEKRASALEAEATATRTSDGCDDDHGVRDARVRRDAAAEERDVIREAFAMANEAVKDAIDGKKALVENSMEFIKVARAESDADYAREESARLEKEVDLLRAALSAKETEYADALQAMVAALETEGRAQAALKAISGDADAVVVEAEAEATALSTELAAAEDKASEASRALDAAETAKEKAAANAMERGTRAVKRVVNFEDLGVDEGKKLGSGASGTVYRGEMDGFNVAIKVYNNMGKTSDGRPEDEMAAASLATSTTSDIVEEEQDEQEKTVFSGGVIETLAKFTTKDGKRGLVMEYLDPTDWKNLGGPPSFETVTRDVFDEREGKFTAREILAVAVNVAKGINQLHKNGVCHGDIYAHNILIDRDEDYPSAKLGDFGAAMFFDDDENPQFSQMVRENEARAFGCLLDDMLVNYDGTRGGSNTVMIRENIEAGQTQYAGNKIFMEPKSYRPSTHLDNDEGKTEGELTPAQSREERERRRDEHLQKRTHERREADKGLVSINLPEDGHEKTIASLRQLADDLMHPTRSVRPKNFEAVVKRVQESEKLFFGDYYAKKLESLQILQRRRYDVDLLRDRSLFSRRKDPKRREKRNDDDKETK